MNERYERYTAKFKKRLAELPYRQVRRKNLDRIGDMVRESMAVAGDTSPSDRWRLILKEIDAAHSENPEHTIVMLWRLLCNFSVSKPKPAERKEDSHGD